jgi:hypothetical protein
MSTQISRRLFPTILAGGLLVGCANKHEDMRRYAVFLIDTQCEDQQVSVSSVPSGKLTQFFMDQTGNDLKLSADDIDRTDSPILFTGMDPLIGKGEHDLTQYGYRIAVIPTHDKQGVKKNIVNLDDRIMNAITHTVNWNRPDISAGEYQKLPLPQRAAYGAFNPVVAESQNIAANIDLYGPMMKFVMSVNSRSPDVAHLDPRQLYAKQTAIRGSLPGNGCFFTTTPGTKVIQQEK